MGFSGLVSEQPSESGLPREIGVRELASSVMTFTEASVITTEKIGSTDDIMDTERLRYGSYYATSLYANRLIQRGIASM